MENEQIPRQIFPILDGEILIQTPFPFIEKVPSGYNTNEPYFDYWLTPTRGVSYFFDKQRLKQCLPIRREQGVDWAPFIKRQATEKELQQFLKQ